MALVLTALTSCILILLSEAAPLDSQNAVLTQTRVVFGDETTLRIAEVYAGVWHMEADQYLDGTSILLSWGSSLKTSFESSTVVGSIDIEGYIEGIGKDARFNEITGFLQISKTQVIVVDRSNHCLRMVDRVTASTSHLAGTCMHYGYVDGVGGNAMFNMPSGILYDERDMKSVIVVDNMNHALRSMNLDTKEVTTIVINEVDLLRPRSAVFDKNDKNIIYITIRFKVMQYSFADKSLKVLSGEYLVGGFADGKLADARFGYFPADIVYIDDNLLAVADFWNQDVRLINLKSKQVTSLCRPLNNDSSIEGVGCTVDNPHGLLFYNDTLYVGDAASINMIPVSFVKPGDAIPNLSNTCKSRDLKVIIAAGADTATVKVDSEHTLLLSVGKHQYISKGCVVNFLVKEATIEKRVEVRADYDFYCPSLTNSVASNLAISTIENNYIHVLEICQGVCTKKSDSKPRLECTNNLLSVFYPTNLVYSEDVSSIPQDLYDNLTGKLVSKGTMMSIVDTTKHPPILFPRGNADGSSARVVLTTSCLNKGTYDELTDSCL